MANEITAKNVRTLAPGGGVANFMGITGDSHKYFWLSTDLIKLMLDRHIRVFERLLPTEEQATNDDGEKMWYYIDPDTGATISIASEDEPVPGEGDIPDGVEIEPVMVTVENGEVELDEDNYTTDNGGETLEEGSDIVVIQDLEGQRQDQYDAEMEAWLEEIGKTIKERQDAISGDGDEEEDPDSGLGSGLGMGTPETPTLSEGE